MNSECRSNAFYPLLSALIILLGFGVTGTQARDFVQLPGVIHVHSTFSSGRYSLDRLVDLARRSGLEVLVITDHDRVVMEYGLFPLRHLIKRREERSSVVQAGPANYLGEIARLNQTQADVVVIPGVQTSPFYYWYGNPLTQTATAHGFRKELLVIGLQNPGDYLGLPVLNGSLSLRYFWDLLPRTLFFASAFGLGLVLIRRRRSLRSYGVLICGANILLLLNYHPFQSSRFDAYHGDQGVAPFQEVIDYVEQKEGLVFWTHPESNYSTRALDLGPIRMTTAHYPDDLTATHGYTGFAGLYGDTGTVAEPGRHWDQILNDYCRQRRSRAVWAIAEADFHGDRDGERIDRFQTVFLVQNKSRAHILEALARGRVYAVQTASTGQLQLDDFRIADEVSGQAVWMGDTLTAESRPVVSGKLSVSGGERHDVQLTIIRGGQRLRSIEGWTPLEFNLIDTDPWSGKTFYRLQAQGKHCGRLLSNPIFVSRK